MATEAQPVPRVSWDEFMDRHLRWRQGEHVLFVGPTGSGKTTLALALLPLRAYVVALATKSHDDTMNRLIRKHGWKKISTWAGIGRVWGNRKAQYVLWPRMAGRADLPNQQAVMAEAFDVGYATGGWCFFIDELWWIKNKLRLENDLEMWWSQGRSSGLTIVAGTQRPKFIPLMAYDQSTHLFFWRDNDVENLKRLAGLNGLNAATVRETVASLPKHDVLYVNTRTGTMLVTRAPKD